MAVSPKDAIGLVRHLGHEFVMRPGRVTEQLLNALVITVGDVPVNALHVFTPIGSQQPGQVIGGMWADILAANQEMLGIIGHEAQKSLSNVLQALESIFSWRGVLRAFQFIVFGILCWRFCPATTDDNTLI